MKECQGLFLRIKQVPPSVGMAGLRLEQAELHLERAGLGCGRAGLDCVATGLHLIETALHHGAAGLYLVAVKLVLFAYFTTNSKGEKNTPKTHKALYLRAFCVCGGCQGRDVKIFLSGLDRLAGSRRMVAISNTVA